MENLTEKMISKIALSEFKEIYLREYGEELADKEALEKATQFLSLMKAIYKPIPNTMNTTTKEVK